MKRILNLILLIFISTCSFGQDEKHILDYIKMTETDSLYLIAIEKYTNELDALYTKNTDEENDKIIYIQYESYLQLIPSEINGYEIQKLGLANRKKHFKANKNKLYLVEISTLRIENGRFSITLIPYFAELKRRKKLHLSLSGWTNVFFEYINGKLIYEKTENGGI
jgi:hypothetical protein